ncbi:MAG: CRISPR-associated endonuclease Cas2 [Staphylococcus sp.]|nr:CRISPR-associated endonuclease Cas2 [Staphylococcus sp.]
MMDGSSSRFSQYRVMWIMVFFDLPTETKRQRKNAATFRKRILTDGFTMFQFSIYIRHCPSKESADVHIRRVHNLLPPEGKVGILCITDKQFASMELFYQASATTLPIGVHQLELF